MNNNLVVLVLLVVKKIGVDMVYSPMKTKTIFFSMRDYFDTTEPKNATKHVISRKAVTNGASSTNVTKTTESSF